MLSIVYHSLERGDIIVIKGMDHRYIDEHSVAGRYLEHKLATGERAEFEAHLVDCQECADRLLLAGMFHSRNGVPKPTSPEPQHEPLHRGIRVRLALLLRPGQVFLVLAIGAALLIFTAWLSIRIIR